MIPRPAPVGHIILTAWTCPDCDVTGRTPPEDEPECWNCGGRVVVTARPAVPAPARDACAAESRS
ncbi:hypothetical protein ABT337_32975 [Saccharopolyspora hirsuta]|uniref:Uncharacterized protein n=1 Tax=Saccharopolyspora hirsuta TaxID=1837 RepID=A0A5M7BEK3_SACHI|nr:hypothetical protein [Saccharopolyspora hirsuta]KAA5825831.1 hypothetical protein F1721_32240 [Saccharopolyspora hirsuta]